MVLPEEGFAISTCIADEPNELALEYKIRLSLRLNVTLASLALTGLRSVEERSIREELLDQKCPYPETDVCSGFPIAAVGIQRRLQTQVKIFEFLAKN